MEDGKIRNRGSEMVKIKVGDDKVLNDSSGREKWYMEIDLKGRMNTGWWLFYCGGVIEWSEYRVVLSYRFEYWGVILL